MGASELVAEVRSCKLEVFDLILMLLFFLFFFTVLLCRESFMFIVISYTLFSCLYIKTKNPKFYLFLITLI